jgi:hypothetical protein
VAAANAKLALFYDWLFYDAERDNIMNIGKDTSFFFSLFLFCLFHYNFTFFFTFRTCHISHVSFYETSSSHHGNDAGLPLQGMFKNEKKACIFVFIIFFLFFCFTSDNS